MDGYERNFLATSKSMPDRADWPWGWSELRTEGRCCQSETQNEALEMGEYEHRRT